MSDSLFHAYFSISRSNLQCFILQVMNPRVIFALLHPNFRNYNAEL